MKCPHCLTSFHDEIIPTDLGADKDSYFTLLRWHCPACKKFIFSLLRDWEITDSRLNPFNHKEELLVYPRGYSRSPLPHEVPEEFAEDYKEACQTLSDSPKASAALSRRCLQHVLREKGNVKHGNLASEIQQVIDAAKLPSQILESLDAIRNIGNFAAHPMKSTATGEVLPVEAGEAEWNLNVLESLFDFYFVQPAVFQKKKDALNAKLSQAGKPPMK